MIELKHCDNLELLKSIEDNTVDLIYCDILYGTGRDFGDYKDLKANRQVIEEHYIPRLKEMHRVLKDTGSIYLQMDTKINHWLRCIMDDVFGYDNFRNEIVWKRVNSVGSSKSMFQSIPNVTDRVIFYTKTKDYNLKATKVKYQKSTLKKYNQKDNKGFYCWQPLKTASKEKIELLKSNNEFQDKGLFKYDKYKLYLDINKGVIVGDLWADLSMVSQTGVERTGYQTQKPKALLERIIKASSNEGDLVCDFYGGSFTTAVVCQDLNRNFLGCDINPKAVELGYKRLNEAAKTPKLF